MVLKEVESASRKSRVLKRPRRYRSTENADESIIYKYVKVEDIPSIDYKETIDKIQTYISSISDLIMKNHMELIPFKPSEIALVIILKARLLSNIKDNSIFSHEITGNYAMDLDSIS